MCGLCCVGVGYLKGRMSRDFSPQAFLHDSIPKTKLHGVINKSVIFQRFLFALNWGVKREIFAPAFVMIQAPFYIYALWLNSK